MPGGTGPVSEATVAACARRGRALGAVRNANEIFYHLNPRHVYFDRVGCWLYFVDSAQGLVQQTVLAALAGCGVTAAVEQLHLDRHGCFAGARRVSLRDSGAAAALVALRLAGVKVTAV